MKCILENRSETNIFTTNILVCSSSKKASCSTLNHSNIFGKWNLICVCGTLKLCRSMKILPFCSQNITWKVTGVQFTIQFSFELL